MFVSAVLLRAKSGSKGFALGVFDALAGSLDDARKLALGFSRRDWRLDHRRSQTADWGMASAAARMALQNAVRCPEIPASPGAASSGICAMAEGALTTKVSI